MKAGITLVLSCVYAETTSNRSESSASRLGNVTGSTGPTCHTVSSGAAKPTTDYISIPAGLKKADSAAAVTLSLLPVKLQHGTGFGHISHNNPENSIIAQTSLVCIDTGCWMISIRRVRFTAGLSGPDKAWIHGWK